MIMNWNKIGQIFNPTKWNDGIDRPWMRTHAQCPSALVLKDAVRIYFSSRPYPDINGKHSTNTGYLDLDKKDLTKIISVSEKPLMELGSIGDFDQYGIYPSCIMNMKNEYRFYYAGWSRCDDVPFNTSIGMAISTNGKDFERYSKGPILGASPTEPFVISGPKVRKFNDNWYMFYLAGTDWKLHDGKPEIIYKIKMATSTNGIDWQRENRNIIVDKLNIDECQAGPDVFYHDGLYRMYFVYREGFDFREKEGRGYKIGYATSKDLLNWDRDDSKAGICYSKEGWDSTMQHYPHIFNLDGKIYMIYNGNEFGKYGFGLAELV